ncbi:MAG: beta-ketoacyl-ACP synthase III [Phycisphaerales bacterium JB054]
MSPAPTGGDPTPRSGIAIIGTGSAVPQRRVTNTDLEACMDTSDEWIVQRTGIRTRHIHDPKSGESTESLATEAAQNALDAAGVTADQLDLIVCGTMTPDMPTPSVANLLTASLGARTIPAFDLNAACSGFVYAMNTAHALMTTAPYTTALVLGVDCVTKFCKFSNLDRSSAVLFGDAGGACVLSATGDTSRGLIAQAMHSDGDGAKHLYIPTNTHSFLNPDDTDDGRLNTIVMNGRNVFKFAVSTFPELISQTLDKAGLAPEDIDHYICHQSNARILAAARERFSIPEEKFYVNIERYGNTVGASVPLILDQQTRAGRVKPGDRVMFLAFGAGLTWASSLWQV